MYDGVSGGWGSWYWLLRGRVEEEGVVGAAVRGEDGREGGREAGLNVLEVLADDDLGLGVGVAEVDAGAVEVAALGVLGGGGDREEIGRGAEGGDVFRLEGGRGRGRIRRCGCRGPAVF